MKKLIIGTSVGALFLFVWQFLSFAALDIHGSQMEYTNKQDTILKVLSENLEEGSYFLPRAPREAFQDEQQAMATEKLGTPWAIIHYHETLSNKQGMNMFRGFMIDLLAVFLLSWVLSNMAELTVKTAVLTSLAIGFIGYLSITYLNSIWFETTTLPDLLDAIVQWGLIGAWLGWWLPRGQK